MLKFLTHKLRTHSLNEENVSEKVEERDSGTESDDEAERTDTGDFCTDVIMKWNDVTDISMGGEACACAPTPPRLLPEPEPDHLYDHHSSEEELEVINAGGPEAGAAAKAKAAAPESRRRGASSPPPSAPEKRKWPAQPYLDADDLPPRAPSDDDDDTKVETPVRFRTSPPLEALKPRRAGAGACGSEGGRRRRAVVARGRRPRRGALRLLLVMPHGHGHHRRRLRAGDGSHRGRISRAVLLRNPHSRAGKRPPPYPHTCSP